jgi:ubiquinone/menaquinone biosynthesis C-methylase UbiE
MFTQRMTLRMLIRCILTPQRTLQQLGRRFITLRNKLAVATQAGETLQQASEAFWLRSSFTYLASPEYYDRRERLLTEVLTALPPPNRVIDIGCGDGRFTCLFARFAASVEGYDLSPALVDQARKRAQAAGLDNVFFSVCELDDLPQDSQVDLLTCMGVSSCLTDESKYARLLNRITALVRPGGRLIMIDSLTKGQSRYSASDNGYVARYRNDAEYRQSLRDRGFVIDREIDIQAMGHNTNWLLLLTKKEGR